MLNQSLSLSLSLVFVACIELIGGSALAAESDGSVEAMWNENTSTLAQNKIKDAENTSEKSSQTSKSAGICALEAFLPSDLMKTTVWPGIGPFKADPINPLEFKDEAGNHLNLITNDMQVTSAQLDLAVSSSQLEDFLKMQMGSNFLLEGLGLRPDQINEFNLHLEKEKAEAKKKTGPFNFHDGLGATTIYVESLNTQNDSSTNRSSYRIKVALTLLGLPKTIKTSTSNREITSTVSEETNQKRTVENAGWNNEKKTASNNAKKVATIKLQTSASTGAGNDNKIATSNLPKNDRLKQEFMETITHWQSIKKKAVRQRQTNDLGIILSGKALIKQGDAVKWLSANHKYYEMNPKGATIQNITELAPEKKYIVFASVKENTKYFDDTNGTGQLIKDADDTYNVNYTIEKIGGHWLITDSSVVKTTNSNLAQKGHH